MERKMMNTENRFVKTRVAPVGVAVALATALLLLVGLANPAPAASTLVNGDFETSDTTGWTASTPGNTQVVTTHVTANGSYQPVDGNYFALLRSGQADTPVKLSQSFFADPGMTVSGDTFFQTNDGFPFNDSGQVVVRIKEDGTTVATPFNKSVSDVGDGGQTPWTHWEHTFTEPGEYTIEASVVNAIDGLVSSFVGLDAVELSSPSYAFDGFFSPVDNQPTYNEAKAGSAIPVKFSLSGDQGLEIFEADYPKSEHTKCNSMAQRDGIEETATAGSSSLSYDATTDQYTYVWKTEKAWSDSCRQLVILLDDGTFHRANFNFVK
jgi:hypothetical protein